MEKDKMIGERYGMLTVLSYAGLKGTAQHKSYLVRCDCGNEKTVIGASVRAGRTRSCGCLAKEHRFTSKDVTTHGQSGSPTYRSWVGMKIRCSEKASRKSKKLYYDKGIRVCDRWMTFANFLADMGERPIGKSIDRIDGNGNYEPSNCRWATPKEQGNNTDFNHVVEWNGKRQTIAQWADDLGIKQNTMFYRLKRAFTAEKHI